MGLCLCLRKLWASKLYAAGGEIILVLEKSLLFICGLLGGLIVGFFYRWREKDVVVEEIKEISMANVVILEKILDVLEALLVELTSRDGGVKRDL